MGLGTRARLVELLLRGRLGGRARRRRRSRRLDPGRLHLDRDAGRAAGRGAADGSHAPGTLVIGPVVALARAAGAALPLTQAAAPRFT